MEKIRLKIQGCGIGEKFMFERTVDIDDLSSQLAEQGYILQELKICGACNKKITNFVTQPTQESSAFSLPPLPTKFNYLELQTRWDMDKITNEYINNLGRVINALIDRAKAVEQRLEE